MEVNDGWRGSMRWGGNYSGLRDCRWESHVLGYGGFKNAKLWRTLNYWNLSVTQSIKEEPWQEVDIEGVMFEARKYEYR